MRLWSLEFKVGIVISLAIIFFVFLLFNASDWQWGGGKRRLQTKFRFVGDIQEGASVYLSGVSVGKVRRIRLIADGALVEADITDDEQPLRVGCKATITMIGIIGESVLSLENGPSENPLLPEDVILEGQDPVNIMEMINEAGEVFDLAVQTVVTVQTTIEKQDAQVTRLIEELRQLIQETQGSLSQTTHEAQQLMSVLGSTVGRTDMQLANVLTDLQTWILQTQHDSQQLIAQINATSEKVSELIDSNEADVQQTFHEFAAIATELRELTGRVGNQSEQLERQLSDLLTNVDGWIAEERPHVHALLEGLNETNAQLKPILASADELVRQLDEGEGTLPRLLHDDSTLEALEETFQEAQTTLTQLNRATQSVIEKAAHVPDLGWDYELRYRRDAEQLQNAANLILRGDSAWDYSFGITSRADALDFNAQVAYHLWDLTVRAGLIRSEAALGLDYVLLSQKLRLTFEGVGITRHTPSLTFEGAIRPLSHWEIFIGGEAPIRDTWDQDELDLHLGIRLNY